MRSTINDDDSTISVASSFRGE
ncbi:hypothetical protein AYI68_g2105, partial [Smittium mucronatum]